MLSFVHNGQVIIEPCNIPKSWFNPITKITYMNFENLSLDKIYDLGWKNVIEPEDTHNEDFENIVYSSWVYDQDNDIVTRSFTIVNKTYIDVLTILSNKLKANRKKYELSGFDYDLNGVTVHIETDLESQNKIAATKAAADADIRNDTDLWKFKQTNGTDYVVPISNATIIDISNFVYRKIQDSYNDVGNIAYQMLGAGDVATLKVQVLDNTINLNPWN